MSTTAMGCKLPMSSECIITKVDALMCLKCAFSWIYHWDGWQLFSTTRGKLILQIFIVRLLLTVDMHYKILLHVYVGC